MTRSRSSGSVLKRLFVESASPIYVLDEDRRVVFCNQACAAWLAVTEDDLLGRQSSFHSQDAKEPLDTIAAGLCPPPEAFTGLRVSAEVAARRETGQLDRRLAEFWPIASPDGSSYSLVVFVGEGVATRPPPPASEIPDLTPAELHAALRSVRETLSRRYHVDHLIGQTSVMRRIREQVRLASMTASSVLVVGPQGSGRDHVARTIHYGDNPQAAPQLLPVACPILDAELLQAMITAFLRRAREARRGEHPTLLLLDIDQLHPSAQHELSGLLTLPRLDVRPISTSSQSLLKLAEQDRFDRELAYRLSTLVIHLPALADRRADLALLAQQFLEQRNAAGDRQFSGFTPEAMDRLVAHPWPGNLDELAATVAESCQHATGLQITANDLPERIRLAVDAVSHPRAADEKIVLDEFLLEMETEILRRALRRAKGNKAKAARWLGISRARLHRRINQLGLE